LKTEPAIRHARGADLLAELARRLSYRLGLASRPGYHTPGSPEEAVSPEPEVMQAAPESDVPMSKPLVGEPLPSPREFSSGIYTPIYDYDGLRTDPAVIHNHDFMRDERYIKAMAAGADALGHDHKMYWRLHVALWAASRASQLPGDFVECGVWRGFLSTAIITYLDWNNLGQKFYLFDTFEGLIPELLSDKERQNIDKVQHLNSYFKDTFPFVSQHFRKFPRVELVKGPVPDTLNAVEIEKVSFISLDMNCVGPEIAAAKFFWPKMVPGAFMLLDDYGFVSYEEQKNGFDAFAAERGTAVLALPSGQGLIMKDAVLAG
jgi:hypothetical protein